MIQQSFKNGRIFAVLGLDKAVDEPLGGRCLESFFFSSLFAVFA